MVQNNVESEQLEALIEQAKTMTPKGRPSRYTLPELERKAHLDFFRVSDRTEQAFYQTVLSMEDKTAKRRILSTLYSSNSTYK